MSMTQVEKYQLRSLPGRFSGLHMVCLMYAAFKIIDPTADAWVRSCE